MEIKLTTTGRRSGTAREVRLYAFEDGDRLVIVGSRGGSATDPAWAGNLRADPRAVVRRGRETHDVHAHEVDGSERARLWNLVSAAFPLYETYRKRTKRAIPLFVLEPVGRIVKD
ncbi:MAG: nitroreductase family deazaflavin-dependent oxidoreductase [Chloroflexota bacterium]|nr:nitroreductase family deazaflavin-dependent oxidoreductase [Chloroflexota bacterium]